MLLKKSSQFVLQTRRHLFRKFTIQRLEKTHRMKSITCGISQYSAGDRKALEYSSANDDDPEEFDDLELPEGVTNDYLENLCAGDEEKQNKLKHTRLLIALQREKGAEVPKELRESDWIRLLSYEEKRDQISYLHLLYRRERGRSCAKTLSKIETEKYLKKKQQQEIPIITTSGPVIYTLRYNSLFHRVQNSRLDNFYNYRLLQAMMFAPTVLVDCGYESYIRQKDVDRVSIFLANMWAANRNHTCPFHVQFCNLNSQGRLMQRIREKIPLVDDPAYPFFYTSKSYTELYPKRKLVYLTADATTDLEKFSHDEIYILGGLPNLPKNIALSKMKAKKEGLKMAKFPLKYYDVKMNWNQHSFDLSVALTILNDLKETNDWKYAFRHLDQRKFQTTDHPTKMHTLDHAVKGQQHLLSTYDMLLTRSK